MTGHRNFLTANQHKAPRPFSHSFACLGLFSTIFALLHSFSHFWECLFHAFLAVPPRTSLRSENITQSILQKWFGAMIARVSRNPARNPSSEIVWSNDRMAIAQIDSCCMLINSKKTESNNKLCNRPEIINNSPRVTSRNPLQVSFSNFSVRLAWLSVKLS